MRVSDEIYTAIKGGCHMPAVARRFGLDVADVQRIFLREKARRKKWSEQLDRAIRQQMLQRRAEQKLVARAVKHGREPQPDEIAWSKMQANRRMLGLPAIDYATDITGGNHANNC